MGIMDFWGGRGADAEMARAKVKPLDAARVAAYVDDLRQAVYERVLFDAIVSRLTADKALSAPEMVAIAKDFAHGVKVKAKKDALLAIVQERMRLVHAKSKAESAAKTRTW